MRFLITNCITIKHPQIMEIQELSALLKKQLYGTIKQQEFVRLRELIYSLDEQILDECLYQVWEEYTPMGKRNILSFEAVKENLKRIIQPRKQVQEDVEEEDGVSELKTVAFIYYLKRVAAILILPLMVGIAAYYITKRSTINDLAVNEYSIETANGERTRVVLPDGTKVLISANTSFTYPATFGTKNREVKLIGEAYFEVTHNADLPFIVRSKDVNVQVLGTKFNVFAYPQEDYFETSLVEGKIQAYTNNNPEDKIILSPNEKLRYTYASGTMKKTTSDLQVETAWTRGDLYFQSEDLHTVLPKLERYYGVKFNIVGQLPDKQVTASYHETDVNEIMKNLSIHYKFSYKKNGELIYLKFK